MSDTPDADVVTNRQRIDAALHRFAQDQTKCTALAHLRQPPNRLYHYTTTPGLVGITTDNAFWASDARYLNDASELTYAAELIDNVVEEALEAVGDDSMRDAMPMRKGVANTFEYGARPFITCFCEQGDLLSQWRGYGVGQPAFALGLDLSHLATFGDLPPNTFLRKVIYGESDQRAAVREAVATWTETVRAMLAEGVTTQELFPYPAIWALQRALAEHYLCFKHPGFEEECEWRLIKLVDVREELRLVSDKRRDAMMAATRERMRQMGVEMPDVATGWAQAKAEGIEVRFRQSPSGLVPFVELPIQDRAGVFTGRLPLWDVVQGPTANPELSITSLAMYLESRDYGFHTNVRGSTIPLRP